jgi:hypothetical protein
LRSARRNACALRLRHALEIPERLQRTNAEAEIAAELGDIARRAIKAGEIVLEDFHRIETGRGDGPQLLLERPADGNRGD